MARRLGLVVVTCILGCGDNHTLPPLGLVAELSAERVAALSSDDTLDIAIAPLTDTAFAIARADTRGGTFCPQCVGIDPSQCPAICRRSLIEVAVHGTTAGAQPARRVAEVFPTTAQRSVDAVALVVLDRMRVGVAWLDCDSTPCSPQRPKQSCTASYTTVQLDSGVVGGIETLYENRHGELQLAFDPRSRRLLALVGTQRPSGVGVRAAIFDDTADKQLVPWTPFGGASARAPAVAATPGGFLIVADDPAPSRAPSTEPCAESCDCMSAAPPELATGGLFAFWPGLELPTTRIAPGRGSDGAYSAREAVAAIDNGGRALVAASQAIDRSEELFEPAIGGWLRRHVSQSPSVAGWVGALGDGDHVAWLGIEPATDGAPPTNLVASVVTDDAEERAVVSALAPGSVLGAAPVVTETGATQTFLLRGLLAPGVPEPAPGARPSVFEQFEVLAVRAAW